MSQIHRKLWIWSHLLKKSLVENFIFCAVHFQTFPEDLFEIAIERSLVLYVKWISRQQKWIVDALSTN